MQSLGKHNGQQKGFTRIELFVVISAIVVLFMIVSPMLAKRYAKSGRIKCSSNLKQIALAFKMYAGDNDERFPWIPKTSDTSFSNHLQAWEYFQIISNELGSVKILLCPGDIRLKQPVFDFSDTIGGLAHPTNQNKSVSYFLGIYSSQSLTNSILTGDRTMAPPDSTKLYTSRGTIPIEVFSSSIWSSAPMETNHANAGNYALADGSVHQTSSANLQETLKLARDSYGTNANRFLFPQ